MNWRAAFWVGMSLGGFTGFILAAYVAGSYARARPDCASLTGARQLECVNRAVNRDIRAVSDLAHYGREDLWVEEPADGMGDCEDYVLTKARRLERLGWNPARMSVAMFTKGPKEPHAVLVIDGEMVLDNLSPWLEPWTRYYRPGSALFPIKMVRAWIPQPEQFAAR